MNAQDIAALGNIVRESIADHVAAATKALSEVFAEQLKGRDEIIESLQREVKTLRIAAEDVSERVDALARAEMPAPYDDSALRKDFDDALADTDRRVELAQKMAVYDDQWIRQTFDAVQATLDKLKAVGAPKPYDDSGLRNLVDGAIKVHDAQITVLGEQIAELSSRPAPAPGIDGKDALALEVLPEIDPAKSYVRNTYAKHNGGLWRSFEQTHGMRGWEVIVDGVHAVMPVLEGKSLTVRVIQSSGTESILHAELPIQEYKGVYRPEEAYLQHDTATWAGSLWHCNVTGTKAKPGDGSSDWTLAVKKGRDARETVKIGG